MVFRVDVASLMRVSGVIHKLLVVYLNSTVLDVRDTGVEAVTFTKSRRVMYYHCVVFV